MGSSADNRDITSGAGRSGTPTPGLGDPAPRHPGFGIELVGHPAHRVAQLAIAQLLEATCVACEPQVDQPAVLPRKAGGLADQDGRPPLAEVSRSERGSSVGHLGTQHLAETQQLLPAVGRHPARERDLGRHAPATTRLGDATLRLLPAP